MAKDRETPCKFYVCEENCEKGREGTHNSYCQHCKLYTPRAKVKHINLKKQKLDKIRKKEFDRE
jgi:hypothetical protein